MKNNRRTSIPVMMILIITLLLNIGSGLICLCSGECHSNEYDCSENQPSLTDCQGHIIQICYCDHNATTNIAEFQIPSSLNKFQAYYYTNIINILCNHNQISNLNAKLTELKIKYLENYHWIESQWYKSPLKQRPPPVLV